MKNFILLAFLVLTPFVHSAQTEVFAKIKQLIQEKHPEIDLNNKLLGFVVWSKDDAESRNQAISFEKSMSVYENAKLKGGSKGIAIIAINKENLSSEAIMIMKKDNIIKLTPIKLMELNGVDLGSSFNAVFDNTGMEVFRNLNSADIFPSINKLITRIAQ